ncbi:UvrD-helicase domain-containing protein [Alistipes sp. OttesenSCG-928-B03]|nr:UvrD-helicase domain-containing protein [Alistipes sp. OttesenSCG-928-B03]
MGNVKLLKASAGSGKTYQLAYEYVRAVIDDPSQYRHILAVTFTNKATEEMKRRIVAEINDLAMSNDSSYLSRLSLETGLSGDEIQRRALSARTKILHDYGRFAILTIDKFFQRIIRSFIRELGLDLNFNLELQTTPLLSQAADGLVDEISVNERLREWIVAFVEEKIEENKRWEIKGELVSLGSEIFRERFRRAPVSTELQEQLGKIVSQASQRAAAIKAEMSDTACKALEVIASNALSVSDFSGGARSFANYFTKSATGNFEAPNKSVLAALESDEKWAAKTSPRRHEIEAIIPHLRPLLQQLCDEYESNYQFLNGVELIRRNFRNFALLSDLQRKVEAICADEGRLPISETNNILSRLIAGNDTPFIFEKAGNHFTRFMIDEFQDTSSLQWENFVPLLHNSLAQSADSPVLLVGDVKQSIYRWRGGDWRILAGEIEREFGGLKATTLDTNFRSFGNIVHFNNELTKECVIRDNSTINDSLDAAGLSGLITSGFRDGLRDTLALAYDEHAQKPNKRLNEGHITITVYNQPDSEGTDDCTTSPVIRQIEELQARGYRAGDIAVLVRTRAEGVAVANMLLEHKEQNPRSAYSYNVVTQEALLLASSDVVGFVTACFRLATAPSETVYRAVFNKWLGRPLDAEPETADRAFFTHLSFLPPEEAFEAVVMNYRLGDNQADIAYLQAFQEQILSFSGSAVSDLQLFLRWWSENGDSISVEVPAGDDAITISTIHKSKGLQYKAVIIPYCNWSLNPRPGTVLWADASRTADGLGPMPVAYSEKMRNSPMAEDYYRELVLSHVDNLNVFYVAVTRAMEELHIMMPADAKRRENRINTLVLDALADINIAGLAANVTENDDERVCSFGVPIVRNDQTDSTNENLVHSEFGTYSPAGRLRLRMPTDRYIEDRNTNTLSPRDYGILMHRVFESARDVAGIEQTIIGMEQDGQISSVEASSLRGKIGEAFTNPIIASWFSGDWEQVHNENDIIVPGSYSQRRPDRVMLRDKKAVVVDYKFGLARTSAHRRQIATYAELLRGMGYIETEGYIWYVSLNDIERII